jgi:hypothetical protein
LILTRARTQDPDDSVDSFQRAVRRKTELESSWRKQLGAVYKERTSQWLADNVMVVDDSGDWCAQ